MSSDWSGLEQLTEQIAYWTTVHEFLIAHTETGKPDAPSFGAPYLDANRLLVPDHPKNGPTSSDSWAWFSIIHEHGLYSLARSGFSRGSHFTDEVLFSSNTFEYTAKYFLFFYQAEDVRASRSLSVRLEPANWQFLRRGPADGWESLPERNSPLGPAVNTIYRHSADPDGAFYLAQFPEEASTYYVDLPWHEISRLCADGIPGINHIPIPGE